MSKKDVDDAVPDVRGATPCNGNTTPTPTTTTTNGVALSSSPTSSNGVDPSATDPTAALPSPQFARDPPDAHPYHHAHDPACVPDPQLSLPPSSYHRLSTQSVTSLTSSRPAPPSPAVSRRASGLSRASSRPVSGMNSNASSRPVSGIQRSRPVSGGSTPPASGTVQPTTPTPSTVTTPTTPSSFPRHPHDRLPNLVPTMPASNLDPAAPEPTPTPTQTATTATTTPALIQIRDYGFASTDPRFTGQGPHVPRANRPAVLARRLASSSGFTPTSSSEGNNGDDDDDDYEDVDEEGERMDVDVVQRMWEEVVEDGTNGWSGFKWGFGRAWGFEKAGGAATGTAAASSSAGFPSRGDLDRNFGGEDEHEDMEIDDEGEVFSDDEGEADPPLFPGLYRALYAFEPEGTAEMKLDEDQLVRVIGRGGGVGWAVVVEDGLKDTGVHALVPESYLELVRLDGEEEDV